MMGDANLIASLVISAVVAVVLFGVIATAKKPLGYARNLAALSTYKTSDGFNQWMAPAILFSGAGSAKVLSGLQLTMIQWLAASIIVGLLCAILNRGPMKTIRDLLFSIVGAALSVILIMQFLATDASAVYDFVSNFFVIAMLLAAFLFGLLLNLARTFALPRLGLSFLGALELLIFFASPFGISLLDEVSLEMNLMVLALAAVFGFAAGSAPEIIIVLASVAICIAEVGINVYLWMLAMQENRVPNVDWSGAVVIIGLQIGIGLLLGALGARRALR